jgi:hypothetical protein
MRACDGMWCAVAVDMIKLLDSVDDMAPIAMAIMGVAAIVLSFVGACMLLGS